MQRHTTHSATNPNLATHLSYVSLLTRHSKLHIYPAKHIQKHMHLEIYTLCNACAYRATHLATHASYNIYAMQRSRSSCIAYPATPLATHASYNICFATFAFILQHTSFTRMEAGDSGR